MASKSIIQEFNRIDLELHATINFKNITINTDEYLCMINL